MTILSKRLDHQHSATKLLKSNNRSPWKFKILDTFWTDRGRPNTFQFQFTNELSLVSESLAELHADGSAMQPPSPITVITLSTITVITKKSPVFSTVILLATLVLASVPESLPYERFIVLLPTWYKNLDCVNNEFDYKDGNINYK